MSGNRMKACTATLTALLAILAILGALLVDVMPNAAATTGAPSIRPAVSPAVCTGVLVARLDGSIAVVAPGGEACASGIAQGSLAGFRLNAPIIGSAALPNGNGYWLLASDGGVFSFGQAQFWGSTGSLHLNAPVVGMASTPDGRGYWLVASDGGIFSFGDAQFHGSTGAMHLNKPVVGMASDGATGGYWLVASDGGVFAFNAPFFGSMGGQPLNAPMRFMTGTPDFGGYRLVASDGGVFDYGDAQFYGSAAGPGSTGWSALATTPDNGGYWLFAATGVSSAPGYQAFGNAAGNLSFVGGDGQSTAFVVSASTVSFPLPQQPSVPPSAGGAFYGVSCAPSTTNCVAVGATRDGGALIERSTDGGASFTGDSVPTGAPGMTGVDCNSTVHCVAVGTTNTGTDAMWSDDGGVTWSLTTTPAALLNSVACENDSDCAAVGATAGQSASIYSTDGGHTWQNSLGAPYPSTGVTCDTFSSTCIAAGEGPSVSTDAGDHWTDKTISGGTQGYFAASCTVVTSGSPTCLAIGTTPIGGTSPGDLGLSTDGGATWTNDSSRLPASSASLQSVACWTSTACMVVGPDESGNNPSSIIGSVTTNAGATFGPLFQPGIGTVSYSTHFGIPQFGFTCDSSGTCIVAAGTSVGAVVYTTSNDGATWKSSTVQ